MQFLEIDLISSEVAVGLKIVNPSYSATAPQAATISFSTGPKTASIDGLVLIYLIC